MATNKAATLAAMIDEAASFAANVEALGRNETVENMQARRAALTADRDEASARMSAAYCEYCACVDCEKAADPKAMDATFRQWLDASETVQELGILITELALAIYRKTAPRA